MKPRILNSARLSFPLATALAALLAASSASATSLYWDSNTTTAGSGDTPTGTWGTSNFWNTDSTGGAGGAFQTATLGTDDLFFSAGTDAVNPYTIGLNSATQNARLVTFEDGTATLNAGTLSLGNGGGITVTTDTVTGATISSGLTITGSQIFTVDAGRTLTLDTGTFTRNAGSTLNVANTGTVTTTMTNLASGSLVNGIIGPWASFGSGASTTYGTIDGSNNIVGLGYTGGADGTSAAAAANLTTSATTNFTFGGGAGTLGGNSFNTLRYTGTGGAMAGAFTANGIMNVSGNTLTFSGAVTSGTGEMVINAANGGITLSTTLGNNGNLVGITGSGNSTVTGVISGAGGLLKSGTGTLTLSSNASTYAGQLTVANGTLSIASINNVSANGTLGNSALAVILGSTGNTGTLSYTGGNATSTKRFTFAAGGTGGINVSTGATNLTLSGLIDGTGNLLKTGAGTLTLSNAFGFAGNIAITNGKVALGGQFGLWQSAYDTTGSTGAIGLNVTGQVAPWIGGLAGSVNLATAITGYGSVTALTLNPQAGFSVSYGGVIANGSGAMTLSKTGHGTQILTGTNTYTGATTVWAGTLSLAGATGTALSSAFTVRGGTLELDNSTNLVASRIADGTALSLGSLTLKGFDTGGVQGETVGATTFAVGGKVTVINGSTTGDRTDLTMGTVTRSTGAAIDFVGGGLGTLGGGADSPNVTSSSLLANTNGILDWATVNGTQWAENNSNSIRAYSGSFFAINSSTTAQNAQVSGSATLSGARVANSLNLIATGATQSLSLGANNLTLGSAAGSPAAILKSGTEAYTISGTGQVRAGSAAAATELIAHVDGGALTISAPLDTDINSIAKGGTGDLILSGTRKADFNGNTSIAGGQLEFQGAGFTLSGVVTGAGGLTVNLNAGQTLTMGNNSNSYAGPTIIKGGYLASPAFGSQGMPGGLTQTPSTNTSQIMSNLILEGGIFYASYVFNKDLGAGPGQVQILAGTSGFVHTAFSGGAASYVLDGSRELVWDSTYFSPTVFVHSTVGNLTLNLANGIDLTGSTRTILVGDATYNANAGGGVSQLGGVIRTSSGTAGLTKTGIGELLLSGASTYNDATTVSAGTLSFSGNANVASANPLGQSSAAAANLLLANGTTLKYSGGAASTDRGFTINGTAAGHGASLNASGSAAINFTNTASPAYGTTDQTRTLTLTGTNTNDNILAANLADNGTGAVSVAKTGTGVWVLSGSSSYTGPTTLNAGTLSASTVTNLGAGSSNLVFNGGTFRPTGGTFINFSSIGHTVVFNSGQTVGLDIPSGTFTVDQVLNQGTGGLTKAGAGTLVINSAHTYTGITTISAGTLRLDDGGVIPNSMINNGVLLVNKTGAVNIGTDYPAMIGGSGSIAFGASTTQTITSPTQFESSALNTTGAGSVDLSGVTTPVFGGLVGTSGNLSSTFSSGYSGVTNLTLNTPSGTTFTYAGVINDGAPGMSVTKTGAGTQILTGTNTYTGTTFLNGGTLTLNTSTGKITGTTAIEFNGGTLLFSGPGSNADIDAIPNGAPITVNSSSTFSVTANAAGGASHNETVGAVTLNAGQMNFNWTNGGSSGTIMTLTSLSRSGTASANFNSGFASNSSRWRVTGAGSTTGGQIIGPWYTTGASAAGFASTDYAVYASDFVAQANIAGSAETTWTTAANAYTMSSNQVLTGTRTITALRNATGAGGTLTLATGANLETYGLLSGAQSLAVNVGTGGVLTTPTGGGNLFITTGGNTITVTAPINNNGGNVTLVKNGSSTLTLTNNSNNYSGGTVLNAGALVITNNGQLGVGGGITVNGSVTINGGDQYNLPRTLTLNEGASLTSNNGFGVTGVFSGNGALSVTSADDHNFTNAANTFTGAISSATAGATNYGLTFASIGDTSGAGLITLVGGSGTFRWTSASGSTTTLANRQFAISGAGAGIISALGTTAASNLVINKDLLITGAAGARTLRLIGTNTGNNTFAGKVTDGPGSGSVVSLTKEEAGTWVLSGANTYSGSTNASAGTLEIKSLADGGSASSIGASGNAAGNLLIGNGATLLYTGSGHSSNRGFTINGTAAGHQATINSSGAGALNLTSTATPGYGTAAQTRTLNLSGANTGTNTLAASLTNNTSGAVSLNKNNAGRWILSGTNTYTGATTVSAGTLAVTGSLGATAVSVNGTSTLAGNGNIGGNVTIGATATHALAVAATPGAQVTRAITGTLTLTAGNILDLTAAATPAAGEYVLATATTAITGTPTTINYNGITGTVSVDTVSTPKRLLLTVTGGPGPVDHFAISTISSPQTVGTPITGITLTAKDASNNTATGFTGTVTFGGTGGFTGTSASFTAGVLTGVSVTPTLSGTSRTFTVDDGASHVGTATFDVQSLYDVWGNGTFANAFTDKLPGSNPDGDGLTNLQEYAFGTDPTASTGVIEYSGGVVTQNGVPKIVSSGGTYYMAFGRRTDYVAAGLTYTVEFSAGLDFWEDNNDTTNPPVQVATDGTINALEVPFVDFITTPSGSQKPTFARVKVELAP